MPSKMPSILALAFALARFAPAADAPASAIVVPNFHPACCGWLADFSVERSHCGNSYLDHLDKVRDDPNYSFALSEVPNMIAMMEFEPGRVEELKRRIREGRVELANAFFLEPTINLSGGEALVKSGVEGLRWQTAVLGARPRLAWMIDVCGVHEQMAQIVKGLGLDAFVYTRDNPTGSAIHWAEAPDGSRALAISPGGYAEWGKIFASTTALSRADVEGHVKDAIARMAITPKDAPVLVLGGSGDYSLPPRFAGNPRAFLETWKEVAPGTSLRFAGPSAYLDAVLPGLRSGAIQIPTMRGGTAFEFNAFWMEMPRVKEWYRRCEQNLQAAEMAATAASVEGKCAYPAQDLYRAWLQMLLNMDRNTLWGAAGGMVFESERSWDAKDRFEWVERKSAEVTEAALRPLGGGVFNPLNWERSDPAIVAEDRVPAGAVAQKLPGGGAAIKLALPALGIGPVREAKAARAPDSGTSGPIETQFYIARIDPATGGLASLKLKPSMREMLGGPANVIVAERNVDPRIEPYHFPADRPGRKRVGNSGSSGARIDVVAGPLATAVTAESDFPGGKKAVRRMVFYPDHPRIDCDAWLEDVPDGTLVSAEFPLADDIVEARRGIPYGFAHAAVARPNADLHGYMKGITPAVRWSHYALAGGGGFAILDRGLPGREIDTRTPLLFLLNACDTYMGYPCSWLSGRGKHHLSYAIVAHEGEWPSARIPRLAWEFNAPPIVLPGPASGEPRSFLRTSDNIIVEALRREGPEIEIRFAECLGVAGTAELRLAIPHGEAFRTDLVGGSRSPLGEGPVWSIPVRAQEIVTLRTKAPSAVEEVRPLLRWDELVPPAKRAALGTRILRKGHPPRGDQQPGPDDISIIDSKAAPEDVDRWRARRFGMFIHWGPVSLKGTEIGWSRGGERRGTGGTGEIPLDVYDNLYKEFNPTRFDAKGWVALAKGAGMKYLVFTTKHHDGFVEFDSKLTDYKITNSPFHRDIVAELSRACHEGGLAFGIYYSPPDWHHPDYRTANHARYIEYLHGQLRELCTNYGKIDMIFFDGLGGTWKDWDAPRLLRMIRELQPGIVINDRAGLPADNGTPEQTIGGFDDRRAWETCMTIGDQWAWKPNDNVKSLKTCIQNLVLCAGGDGNFLFNVGPMPTGEIEARQADRLREMGAWLAKHGESIYGTRGGPFRPGPWGASTRAGSRIFVHVLAWPGERLELPGLTKRIVANSVIGGGRCEVKQAEDAIAISVPAADRKDIDTVVVLELDGPAAEARTCGATPVSEGKPSRASNVYQNMVDAHGPAKALDGDPSTRWATDAGVHAAWLEVDLGEPTAVARAFVSEAFDRSRKFAIEYKDASGAWKEAARGTQIGEGGVTREFAPVAARVWRLNVADATDGPTIWEFQLFAAKKR